VCDRRIAWLPVGTLTSHGARERIGWRLFAHLRAIDIVDVDFFVRRAGKRGASWF